MSPERPRKSELKLRILAEARRLLVARGSEGFSMRRIASTIGVSPTSLYLYFEGKDALLAALVDEGLERLQARLGEARAGALEPRAELLALCRSYLDFALAEPEHYEVMFVLRPRAGRRGRAAAQRRARASLEIFAEALRAEGGPSGESREALGIPLAVSVAWSTLHGAAALCISGRLDAGLDRQVFLDASVRRATETLLLCARPGDSGRGVAEAS